MSLCPRIQYILRFYDYITQALFVSLVKVEYNAREAADSIYSCFLYFSFFLHRRSIICSVCVRVDV
jgi:hypothetical protein